MSIQNWTDVYQTTAIILLAITVIIQGKTISRMISTLYPKKKTRAAIARNEKPEDYN